ncbi:hypothetical protein GPECTOR_54g215 [Gonium pectorale]|uniref:Senescence domain-containing protein n=1 Tax=Gonium pectorale TaxID=33097 RepID=A0A150G6L3_GONPE|nr:hypothetical protein GPECTOR_54g215 [Gonium pectorale]|eukprot:KXZ45474.1 hypothetical protein GPECTOR_54g215 [Gonium pectorale]
MSEQEPLLRIASVTLYQVDCASHAVSTITNGDFAITYSDDGNLLVAQVGPTTWPLSRDVASLRFNDLTYAFELPRGPAGGPSSPAAGSCYYCLTLRSDTPLELIDLLQAVLASGSAYHDQEHIVRQPVPPAADQREAAPGLQQVAQVAQAQPPLQPQQQQQQPGVPAGKADRLADGIQRGGQIAAAGVLAAAMWAGGALHKGAEKAVARMQPADRPANISPQTQFRIEKARATASQLAEVSGKAVGGALSLTAQVAGALAQRIASSGMGQSIGRSRVGTASAQDLRKVGVAGIDAVEAVYDSLADAARIVLAHTHTATTRIVGHKYGADAAMAAGAGIQVAQSAVETGLNVYKLRPTALAKQVVKGTAQSVVRGQQGAALQAQPQPQPHQAARVQSDPGPFMPAPQGAAGLTPAPSAPAAPAAAAPPPLPVAAATTLAAVTAGRRAGAAGGGVSVAGGAVVDGVAVTGPVPAHPVYMDYTPSAAVVAPGGGAGGASGSIPYPPVSAGQYAARYYPPVPQA